MTTAIAVAGRAEITTGQQFDVSILAGQVAESTIKMYKRDFAAYAKYAGSQAAALLPETLAQYRAHLANETTKSPNTINRMLSAVRKLMSEAASQGYIAHATAEQFKRVAGVKVKALKDRQRSHARTKISPEQMRSICEAPDAESLAGTMHRALLLTLAQSGLRISEAVTLTMAQIEYGADDSGRLGYTVSVMGKNKTEAEQRNIGTEAYNAICEWLAAREKLTDVDSEWIFTGFGGRGSRAPRSNHIHAVSAWEIVKRYAAAAQVEHVKPHDFRRFVGTRLVKEHGLRAAQKQLGHANIATTAKHYDLSDLERGLTENLF